MKLTDAELFALQEVVEYLYEDEREDFENQDSPRGHIFVHVQTLDLLATQIREGKRT